MNYDPDTGLFWRKVKRGLKPAGYARPDGYRMIQFEGRQRYERTVRIDGKQQHFGYHDTLTLAAKAVARARLALHGEYARL